jgi:arylsulfatase A-like enzyme
LSFEEALIGGAAYDAKGSPLPDETLAACRAADAIFLGAVGGPKWNDIPVAGRAYADAELGRLIDFMEGSGILDTTYVIVTSDHGELFERGIWGHITQVLFEPLIRIPLTISTPGQRVRRDVHAPTSSVDIIPTLLRIAGVQRPGWCEGELLPLVGDQEARADRAVYSMDAKGSSKFGPLAKRTVSVIRDRHKLTHYLGYPQYDGVYEMYDLNDDPEELRNLYSSGSGMASALKTLLDEKLVALDRQV